MGPVIFSCFAGRERYLKILIPYINQLVDRKLVNEVHMWDYTRNEQDASFLREACSQFTILVPNSKDTWADYYGYYRSWRYPDPDTVLIKCDDDIVYMDISKFQGFIDERRANKDAIMLSPAIINNPACQLIHKEIDVLSGLPIIEETDLNSSAEHARDIHTFFLNKIEIFLKDSIENQPHRLWIIPTSWNKRWRFNINFISILGKDFDILFDNEYIKGDDEFFMSCLATVNLERYIYIDLHFVVAHMAYKGQRDDGFDETPFLEKYASLTDTSEGPP